MCCPHPAMHNKYFRAYHVWYFCLPLVSVPNILVVKLWNNAVIQSAYSCPWIINKCIIDYMCWQVGECHCTVKLYFVKMFWYTYVLLLCYISDPNIVNIYTDFMLLLKYILNSILPHLYFYIAVLILLLTFPPMVTAKRQNFLKIL